MCCLVMGAVGTVTGQGFLGVKEGAMISISANRFRSALVIGLPG